MPSRAIASVETLSPPEPRLGEGNEACCPARGRLGGLVEFDPGVLRRRSARSRRDVGGMTIYLPNSDVRPTGSEVTEFVDVTVPLVVDPSAQSPKVHDEPVDTSGR